MESLIQGILSAISPASIIANFMGVALGIVFGSLPGLTATMGVALLIPLTFGMEPVVGLSGLLGVYVGAIYAGSITATLISTPGTAAAAATLLEGPLLTAKGKSGKALSVTTIGSFIGGIFSCIVLMLVAPQLAKVAMAFGPPEYFALGIFGLSIVAGISSGSILKGLMAALMGLLLSTIGTDPITGTVRFNFGMPNLISGIAFVPALVGLFAISEVLKKLEEMNNSAQVNKIKLTSGKITLSELKLNWFGFLRASVIGTFIGTVPATGSGVASYIAYNEAKRASKTPEKFGTGHIEGLVATETANNAVTGGALIPLLTLGIPGDVVTAVLLGGLMIQGLTPGPMLFINHRAIVIGIFVALIVSNIFMLLQGLGFIKLFVKVLRIPQGILMPIIAVLCVLGSYAIANSFFEVGVMLVFGLLGYVMNKTDFPLPALLIALILSPLVESNFRRAMVMSQNNLSIFFTRPISLMVLIITVGLIIKTFYDERKMRGKIKDNASVPEMAESLD